MEMQTKMRWNREKIVNMIGDDTEDKCKLIMLSNYDLFEEAKNRGFLEDKNPFEYSKQLKITDF